LGYEVQHGNLGKVADICRLLATSLQANYWNIVLSRFGRTWFLDQGDESKARNDFCYIRKFGSNLPSFRLIQFSAHNLGVAGKYSSGVCC